MCFIVPKIVLSCYCYYQAGVVWLVAAVPRGSYGIPSLVVTLDLESKKSCTNVFDTFDVQNHSLFSYLEHNYLLVPVLLKEFYRFQPSV